jgi:hypothetical protein
MGRRKGPGSVRAGALPGLRKLIREVVKGPPGGWGGVAGHNDAGESCGAPHSIPMHDLTEKLITILMAP